MRNTASKTVTAFVFSISITFLFLFGTSPVWATDLKTEVICPEGMISIGKLDFVNPCVLELQDGHIYLLDQTFMIHWVLFKFEID